MASSITAVATPVKPADTTAPRVSKASDHLNGQELYAGLIVGKDGEGNYHLILIFEEASELSWPMARDWAQAIGDDLPTLRELSLLFANRREHLQRFWYGPNPQHETRPQLVWGQNFGNGIQTVYGRPFRRACVGRATSNPLLIRGPRNRAQAGRPRIDRAGRAGVPLFSICSGSRKKAGPSMSSRLAFFGYQSFSSRYPDLVSRQHDLPDPLLALVDYVDQNPKTDGSAVIVENVLASPIPTSSCRSCPLPHCLRAFVE